MDTQEAQSIINNSKDTESDKYKEAKAFLDAQQVEGKKEEPKKSFKEKAKDLKERLVMSPEEMQKMTSERQDVKTGARRSMIANPAVGIVDRVMGNVTGRNEDLLDPLAFKAKDLNADGSIKEKDLQLGNGTSGNFIGAEGSEDSKGSSGGSPSSGKIDGATQTFLDKNNAIANTQEDKEYARQDEELGKRWEARMKNIDKMSDSMKNIDDHLIDQLPTFMWRRYQNGEFGDVGSKDAKLRLAYFAINNVVSKLKMIANADAAARGQGTLFQNTESAYDQYQASNLAQGLENRWNKYKQETQSAMDLAKEGGMSEEKITDSIATISSNNRLQSAFNQMNERQKVFALQVLGEIGDKMGNMNDAQFANTLMGMSAMGDSLDYKEAAGMLIYRFIKDPEKRDEKLRELGYDVKSFGKSLLGK
jgi:hypothetical protein